MKNALLTNIRHLKVLNGFGVNKMTRNLSALQHNLTNIVVTSTSYDVRWDFLQDYFEHYNMGISVVSSWWTNLYGSLISLIQGIFTTLSKFGPRYSIQDYIRLFQWIYKTKEFEEEEEKGNVIGSYSDLSPGSVRALDADTIKLNAYFRT
jgi:hypothetical protein